MNGKILKTNERGSATVIALLVLALLLVFVALSVSRTTNETLATANDAAETRSFTAGEACLENMTQQFDSIFDFQLSPTTTDLNNIRNSVPPNFTGYNFNNQVDQTDISKQVVISGGLLQGLYATRDAWRLTCTTTDASNGVQVELDRTFFNDRVPIFQFGIFYDDDLEFHPGPRFDFGGRVHSNGSLFLAAGTGLYFSSRVSAHREVLTDVGRNGRNALSQWGENVFIRDGSGVYQQLRANMGSALKSGGTGGNVFINTPDAADMPPASRNANWNISNGLFDGNLMALQKNIKLPLKLAGQNEIDYIELIKRGKLVGDLWNNNTGTAALPAIVPVTAASNGGADNSIITLSRYANKPGLRVSLADSKAKLPGCATSTGQPVSGICGIRLDGEIHGGVNRTNNTFRVNTEPSGNSASNGARGYEPRPMGSYQATRLNGERFVARDSNGNIIPGREVWIKIETVRVDEATSLPVTVDVTEDILSLGVTEKAPLICNGSCGTASNLRFAIQSPGNYHSFNGNEGIDSRSIIRLQRFGMDGVKIESPVNANAPHISDSNWMIGTNNVVYNYVKTNECTPVSTCSPSLTNAVDFSYANEIKMPAIIDDTSKRRWVVPFPIKMFDTREGLYNDDLDINAVYGSKYVPDNGVMSMVEIDVGNLRKFLNGDFNAAMPTNTYAAQSVYLRAMRGSDVPESNGWVLYVSDRRGDRDFDGEYDMEDIYGANPGNDGITQPGEELDKPANGLEADYKTAANPNGEAPKYIDKDPADAAAVLDHSYYRRGVRLVNGQTLPGNYIVNSYDTTGFTVASENAVYVQGNYNASGVASYGTPTPSSDYLPQGGNLHIPASVVGDAVMILSNNWRDSRSFQHPFALGSRLATETHIRFAMISGDAKSSFENLPNQGGGDPRLGGGVHNFKRFLEHWGDVRLNYAGSLINLYNARNNNAAFKCCSKVYQPPIRNWTFDTSFLDPTRLPPGTPFFQVLQLTGFQRINN
jgi:Tfp pilus assembly protein PilX